MNLIVWIPELPPTSNSIYIRHPRMPGKILSAKARSFKLRAMQVIQKSFDLVFKVPKKNIPYELHLSIFLEAVENKNSKTGDRYKKIDTSNRIKLIEDTVAEATGLDDRHNFRIIVEKHCDPKNPGIYIQLREIPEEEVGLTKTQYEKRASNEIRLRECKQDRIGRTSQTLGFFHCSPRNDKGRSH